MQNNTVAMREKLERLKIRRTRLQIEAQGIARDIPLLINPALTEIEQMEIATAAIKMDELVMHQGELLQIKSQIFQLEEALGY